MAQASSTEEVGTAGLVGIATGLVSNPVVAYSLYVLKTTGSGLPPGPGGLYGAIGEHKPDQQAVAMVTTVHRHIGEMVT